MFKNLDAGGATRKYTAIKQVAGEYTISELCKLFGVSRSGYYAYLKRRAADRDKLVKDLIKAVYKKYDSKYGYRQIQLFLLQDHGVWINHKKVLRLMQDMRLRSRIRRKYRSHSVSSTGERVAENVLQREFHADAPNKKWVTDVTQYRVADTWLYLSAIKDLFNNEIVAYHMGARNDNQLVLRTFQKAFEKTKDVTGLIVHSDQGSSTRPTLTTTCCQRLAPKSACLEEAIVMITPQWRASSPILKRKGSTLMISEAWMKHKDELKSIFNFTTIIGRKEN
ncbi:IS3 family transposase [Aneurinibacillus aneurinilyticus]|nr:IS3 family transposase [Aneurinibacillus aneurinilyticus]MED0726450.1 IS3 family transposase [Aneurinibacillus aneurinilyticus]MED0734922.1 IS3 family transposase [Aneurinibacillus aneurinilyticus]